MSDDTTELVALQEVAEWRELVARAEDQVNENRTALQEAIREAVVAGVSRAEVARVAGVTRQRVQQLTRGVKPARPRVHAQKQGRASVRVNDPATVPGLPDTAEYVSGVASVRERRRYGRLTRFAEPAPVAELLALHGDAPGRIMLVGEPPLDASTGATQPEQVRAWAATDPGEGWTAGEHYLADPTLPVLRFTHEDGRQVTIMRAAAWWGETDLPADVCWVAWTILEKLIDSVPAFAGAGLADTPATTGRALWLRTIPEGKSYPVLAEPIRELIAATSGQGRIQLMPEPDTLNYYGDLPGRRSVVTDFTYLDGRFMYAALTWGMPVGEPARWTAGQVAGLIPTEAERLFRGRGRWRITATVPAGWSHVGLLPCKGDGGGWVYPDQAGQVFTTWADGAEVWLALSHGWELVVHEGLSWREGKPLNLWRDKLVECWAEADRRAEAHPTALLVSRAIRSILLYTLGAFATRSHPVTRTAPADTAEPPAGAEVHLVGDHVVWQEAAPLSAWTERNLHPEWSAAVWARARVRLVEAALRLPREAVVGFSTDALYVAGGPPDWPDTGKPGEFRTKGHRPGRFLWPATYLELYRLRDESESAR